jgi:hypothetical protein
MAPQLRQFESWCNEFFGALTYFFYPEDETGDEEPTVEEVPAVNATDEEQELLDAEMARIDQAKADALNPTVEVGEVPDGD